MKTRLLILLGLFQIAASAQDGIPYITHFKGPADLSVQNWSICQTSRDVMLFASRLGITAFDGNRWNNTRLPSIPFEIKRDTINGNIYIGGNNSYGILREEDEGGYIYRSLSGDTATVGVIDRIWFTPGAICFAGERSVSIHNRESMALINRWYADRDKSFTGFVGAAGEYFINVLGKGLHRIDADTLFPIVTGYLTASSEILFYIDRPGNRVLVGTSDNRLNMFDGLKYYPFSPESEEYFAENILSEGIVVSDSIYAFSTLYGGVLLVNSESGEVMYKLNYQNGLPDDEIFAIGSDNNNGLWISHGMGISRADLSLPLHNFSNYPGIEGVVTTTLFNNGELFVATNEGLFYLDEVRNYTEVEVLQKKPPAREPERVIPQVQAARKVDEEVETPAAVEEKVSLKRVFSKIFGKKEEAEETTGGESLQATQKATEVQPEPVEHIQQQPKVEYIKRKVSTLKSIDYLFRKVEGLNTRCNSLVATDHGLLVATTAGLYSLEDHKAKLVAGSRFINDIEPGSEPGNYFVSSDDGIMEIKYNGKGWVTETGLFGIHEPVYSIVVAGNNLIWASGINILFSFNRGLSGESAATRTYTFESDFPDRVILTELNDTMLLMTEKGCLFFSGDEGILRPYLYRSTIPELPGSLNFLLPSPGKPWINDGDGWKSIVRDIDGIERVESLFRIFSEIVSIRSDSSGSYWITDSESGIYKINNFARSEIDPVFSIYINKLSNGEEMFFDFSHLEFDPVNNSISVSISAPHYLKETSTRYQYLIENLMKSWSPWSNTPDINLFLKSGTYTVKFRAMNILGRVSGAEEVTFTIRPPFTKTPWFFLLLAVGVIGIVIVFVYMRESKLRHDKRVLEQKVKERTIEIEKKKEQIEIQRDEIFRQKEEITSSITYASRIQDAILPGQKAFRKIFSEHFIIFKPRNIVSGDFYWISENADRVCFAVADCTGHGVPGAIMSMLGISLLNEITANSSNDINANVVLGLLREKVIFSLKQSGRDDEANDGMDIAFCILHRKKKVLEFAGAFNPLYLLRDGKLTEYKADRMPIGYHVKQGQFTNNIINLKSGDAIYIFSDGFYDQFGGDDDKRFSSGRMKKMFTEVCNLPMDEQKSVIEKRYRGWKGDNEQVDDVLMIGIRI